ncbi:S8 family serine peptidase [Fictibacillus sp. BK138]|uniref:S8 family serine peptidase n=1 Tax=Fictibacillus sp. BK138 TaxID=2512121 RepID=UPI00102A08B1|nr:S8 family serine peptidase [Fictibacillus sp. BK138]RZT23278.1 subtilisin family serine protease [Fictibacillus sp. BK138]
MNFKRIIISVIIAASLILPSVLPTHAEPIHRSPALDKRLLQRLTTDTAVEAIVTFDKEMSQTEIKASLKEAGVQNGIIMNALPIAGVVISVTQLELLNDNSKVLSVYYNAPLTYDNEDSTDLTGVDRVREDADFQKKNGGLPVSGKGVGVVINDSGVDGSHKDHEFGKNLVQNVAGQVNLHAVHEILPIQYIENVPATDNNSGHGTHVAGIVGGTGVMSSGKYEGVAPGADLIGYGSGAGLAILDTIGAFDYALTHQAQYGIRVITNSWGDTGDMGTPFDPDHPVNIATKLLYDRNIVTVFSAGNSGPGENTITGNYKKAPWVITVAAGVKDGTLADFSSRGNRGVGGSAIVDGMEFLWRDQPTITAPGKDIVSTRVASPVGVLGTPQDIQTIDPAHLPYYTTLSGTSMAAPHAAGVVALMLDANPLLTPSDVKQILVNSATSMNSYESWETGAGYINAYDAVTASFLAK